MARRNGDATIGIDRGTRDRLRGMAYAAKMGIAEYVRYLLDKESGGRPAQSASTGVRRPKSSIKAAYMEASTARLFAMDTWLASIWAAGLKSSLPSREVLEAHAMEMMVRGWRSVAVDILNERIKEGNQGALALP